MKKITLAFTALVSVCSFGQNDQVQNKNGVDIMPVAGEIGLGMNALPALQWLGNMMNGNTDNTSLGNSKFVDYFGSQNLFGKYMISDDAAIRVNLRYGRNGATTYNYVFNDVLANPDSITIDTYHGRSTDFNIGVGYEFRRGKTRLRGIYGGELLYAYSRTLEDFYYGNSFGFINPAPTSTSWSAGAVSGVGALATRQRSTDTGAINGLGLRLFGGVEYYICPKICLGTEFGWGIGGAWSKMGTIVDEYWDPGAAAGAGGVLTSISEQTNTSTFRIDTDNFNGAMYFMFWF